jgi:hypothetical protein
MASRTRPRRRGFGEGEALPADRAGRDLRLLEAVVEMDRHRVVHVLRILPVRHGVREDGRLAGKAGARSVALHP